MAFAADPRRRLKYGRVRRSKSLVCSHVLTTIVINVLQSIVTVNTCELEKNLRIQISFFACQAPIEESFTEVVCATRAEQTRQFSYQAERSL